MIRRVHVEVAARCRSGISLIELMVVLTILGVLVATAVPSFRKSIEQSRADIAAANLRAIWSAERLYWLENRVFAGSLSDLESSDLIDSTISGGSESYQYAIDAADATTFTATATRSGSGTWAGSFSIDQTGVVAGSVSDSRGITITPGFQD
jgi:prepilin-type N-terminal cleavage/methylation domain-containing protein